MRHEAERFDSQTVRLDGNEYVRCFFHNCRIEFGGSAAVILRANEFSSCTWVLVDAAATALNFLAALYRDGGGGRDLVEATIDNIRRGEPPPPSVTISH